jgi:hypothetical protein
MTFPIGLQLVRRALVPVLAFFLIVNTSVGRGRGQKLTESDGSVIR